MKTLRYVGFILVALLLIWEASDSGLWFDAYTSIQWYLLPSAFVSLILMVIGVSSLYRLSPAIMGFGLIRIFRWVFARLNDDDSPVTRTRLHEEAVNFTLDGWRIRFLGIPLVILFLLALPSIVWWEERTFRQGIVTWEDALKTSILFGLYHAVYGVPVAVVIGISVVGMLLSYFYFEGGIAMSFQLHFQYDLIIGVVGLIAAINIAVNPGALDAPSSQGGEA